MNILFLSIGRLNNIEDKGIYTDLFQAQFRNVGHNVYVVSPREKVKIRLQNMLMENGIQHSSS